MPAISASNALLIILVVAAVTFFTRVIPFLFFSGNKKPPQLILYIGRILPPAIMAMLLIYCLRNVRPMQFPHGIPELIALSTVIALHLWKRNNLISILGGTVLYMYLVQAVFI